MTIDEKATRCALARVEERLVWITQLQERTLGQRDRLLAELLDLEGAHDQRPVAVR